MPPQEFGSYEDFFTFYLHEHSDARFSIVPLFAYGSPPRKELCRKQSLTAALKSARDSATNSSRCGERCWKSRRLRREPG